MAMAILVVTLYGNILHIMTEQLLLGSKCSFCPRADKHILVFQLRGVQSRGTTARGSALPHCTREGKTVVKPMRL